MTRFDVDVVLFDLDGTLADTAPDLVDAINDLRASLALPPVPDALVRPAVSKGGLAMLRAGFPEREDGAAELLERFLACYSARGNTGTHLFDGIDTVLGAIEARGLPWGIVTNKPGFLTTPLLASLGLDARTGVVVCGDTLPVRKPDPAPVRHACAALGADPSRAVLVGDDRRDVESARAAVARAIVAGWGYIGADEAPGEWGADLVLARAGGLVDALGLA